jgi:hypothetical protein
VEEQRQHTTCPELVGGDDGQLVEVHVAGVTRFHVAPTPTCGSCGSSVVQPIARSIERAAAWAGPPVTSRLRRLVAVADVDHVAAQARQASRDLDVLARPAFDELVPRQLGPLADEAEPPDHAPSVEPFETDE